MNTPTLRNIQSADDVPEVIVPRGHVGFVVCRPGLFEGRLWSTGDLVVCQPSTSVAQGLKVLVPVGKGSPMLGRSAMGRISGVHGEPCHPDRWQVVEVIEVMGRAPVHCVVSLQGGNAMMAPARGRRQLALFEGALAA